MERLFKAAKAIVKSRPFKTLFVISTATTLSSCAPVVHVNPDQVSLVDHSYRYGDAQRRTPRSDNNLVIADYCIDKNGRKRIMKIRHIEYSRQPNVYSWDEPMRGQINTYQRCPEKYNTEFELNFR